MEENFPWKIVFIAAGFSLFVLIIAYLIIAPQESTFSSGKEIDKIAEFHNIKVAGRKEGKKSWLLQAESGWVDKAERVTFLNDLKNGVIYQDEKVFARSIAAASAKVYANLDVVEATGPLTARLNLGRRWTHLTADWVKFNVRDKKTEVSGHVKLAVKNGMIFADSLVIDNEKKTALLSGHVLVKKKNLLVKSESAEYFDEKEELNLVGKVLFDIKEKKKVTRVKCSQLVIFSDAGKDVFLLGGLEAVQGKKLTAANQGNYSPKRKSLTLSGGTRSIFEKGEVFLNPKTAAKLQAPDVKKLLKEKTIVIADEIIFGTANGEAKARGSVQVLQNGREARSESAFYDEKNETITLTGSVFLKRGDDWLACKKVVVSIMKDQFEAFGVTESKLKL